MRRGDPGPGWSPSIESTRIYLHLANDRLAGEYRRATEAIDAADDGRAMTAAAAATAKSSDLVGVYATAMHAAGRKTGRSTMRAAKTFCAKLEQAGGWER